MLLILSYQQVLTSDDLLYGYRLDTAVHDPQKYMYGMDHTALPITSVADVIRSQAFHYCNWHGRTLVTAMEQFFSGVSTPQVYYPINVCVVLLVMWMFVRYAVGCMRQWSLWAWAYTIIYFLLGTPGDADILTSINLSANYLWPSAMALGALLLWRHYLNVSWAGHAWLSVGLMFTGLICGWSHEGICLPLSGMWVIYYLVNRAKWRTCGFAVVAGYWLGSLILLAAPGNLLRGGSRMEANHDMVLSIIEAFRSLMYSNTLWIIVLTCVALLIWRRRELRDFAKRNLYIIIAALLALAFATAFYIEHRTFFFFDLLGAILLLRLAFDIFGKSIIADNRWLPIGLIAATFVVYSIFSYYQILTYRNTQLAIDRYLASTDGIAAMPDPAYPRWMEPFIARPRYGFVEDVTTFIGKERLPLMVVVSDEELQALEQGTLFTEANRLGRSDFYAVDTGRYFWTRDSTFRYDCDYRYVLAPASLDDQVDGYRKIARLLNFHNRREEYPVILGFESVDTRYGRFVVTQAFRERKVLEINPVE